jgi:hypothetical protein
VFFHFHFIGETIDCALSKQRGDGNGENGQRA